MSRIANLGVKLQADFSEFDAAYAERVKAVTGNALRVPVSPAFGGQPTGSTLGGLSVPSSAAGAGLPSSANIGPMLSQLTQQIAAAVTAGFQQGAQGSANRAADGAAPGGASNPGFSGTAFQRIYNRFSRAGGAYLAYRGVRALEDQYLRARDLDEANQFEGPEAAARVAAQQTREDRRSPISSAIRTGFVAVLRGFGNTSAQTDDERAAQDRSNEAIVGAHARGESANAAARAQARSVGLENLTPIARIKAEAENRFAATEDQAASLRNEGARINPVSPEAGRELINAAKVLTEAAGKLRDASVSRASFLAGRETINLGRREEAASVRAQNRPNDAARLDLQREISEELATAERLKDPNIAVKRQTGIDRLKGFDADINRRVNQLRGDAINDQFVSDSLLNNNPLQARLRQIAFQTSDTIAQLPNEKRFDDAKREMEKAMVARQAEATKEFDDETRQIDLNQTTRQKQNDALLRHDPVGANVAGIVGSAQSEAASLLSGGRPDQALRALNLGLGSLGVAEKDFTSSFHATEIGQNFDTSNRFDNSVASILKEIKSGQDDLVKAINDLGSD